MPAVESRTQTYEKGVSLAVVSCTRKCLPCSTKKIDLLGDESIAIVLNGQISTGKMEETSAKFEIVNMSSCSQSELEGKTIEAKNEEAKVQEGYNETGKISRSCAETLADGTCVIVASPPVSGIKGNRAVALREIRASTSSLESDEELITDIMQSLTVNVAFSPKSSASFFNVSTD